MIYKYGKLLNFPGLHFFPTVMISKPISIPTPYGHIVNRKVVSGVKLWGLNQWILLEGHTLRTNSVTLSDIQFYYFQNNIIKLSSVSKNQRKDQIK